MIKKYSVLKLAAPPDSLTAPVFFHGSYKESAIDSIFQDGLKGAEIQGKSRLAPVKGGVYLSPDYRYALIYALGGNIIGSSHPMFDASKSPYGFIYTVPKNNLQDIHPDEDSIGELIYKASLNKDSSFMWLFWRANRVATPLQIKKLKQGEYAMFAAVGKKVLKTLTDAEKLLILNSGSHLFHQGVVKVSGAYLLRRDHPELLTGVLEQDAKFLVYITSQDELENAKKLLDQKIQG